MEEEEEKEKEKEKEEEESVCLTFRRNLVQTRVMCLAVVPANFADCAHTAPPQTSVQ